MNKIEIIFNLYKQKPIIAKKFKMEMIKKFKLSEDQIRNLFRNIQNYQIKNYGGILTYSNKGFFYYEVDNIRRNAIQRKYDKLRRKR